MEAALENKYWLGKMHFHFMYIVQAHVCMHILFIYLWLADSFYLLSVLPCVLVCACLLSDNHYRATGVRLPGLHVGAHTRQLLSYNFRDIRLLRVLPDSRQVHCDGELCSHGEYVGFAVFAQVDRYENACI